MASALKTRPIGPSYHYAALEIADRVSCVTRYLHKICVLYTGFDYPPYVLVSLATVGEWGSVTRAGTWQLRAQVFVYIKQGHSATECADEYTMPVREMSTCTQAYVVVRSTAYLRR